MSDRQPNSHRCFLCDGPLSEGSTALESGLQFCSSDCRNAFVGLGEQAHDSGLTDGSRVSTSDDEQLITTFFRVDGMHAANCEAFLESVAEGYAGVKSAEASYVTETIRVDHEPTQSSKADLRDGLTRVGYTAYLREDAADGETGGTYRQREMTGVRKRRSDDTLEMRYIVGIVFGVFVLIPYVSLLYPVHLASIVDSEMLALYTEGFESLEGVWFLIVFFTLTGVVLYTTGIGLLRSLYVGLRLRRPTTDVLAALTVLSAYAYGTLALALGRNDVYYDVTILVAAVVMAAVFHETTVKRRAMDRLTNLTVSQVTEARLYEPDGRTSMVSVDALEAGDRVLVRQGERIPVDGTILENECTVDEAVVTGESLPVSKSPGEDVIGGSVVKQGVAVLEVTDSATSSIERLTRSMWSLQSGDHGIQRRTDRLASVLVPAVLGATLAVGIGLLALGFDNRSVLLGVLLTIIVSSPWALSLATRVSTAESIQQALDNGIVIFDETIFERLRGIDLVVFDKTGTLTTGRMTVLEADAPADLLESVGALECHAAHPAAVALETAFAGGTDSADSSASKTVSEFQSHATGVEGLVDDDRVLVGHPDLFVEHGWKISDALEDRIQDERGAGRLPVVVGRNGQAEGVVILGDEPRDDWEETIQRLGERDIDIVILTGDDDAGANFYSEHPDVDHVFTRVSPDGKATAIRRLGANRQVAMVGDGTNDALALTQADLGISLGGGTALASDAADIAVLEDDLSRVETAFALSGATRRRLEENLRLAFSYNALVVPLAVLGMMNPLFATGAIALTSGLIGLNATRGLLE